MSNAYAAILFDCDGTLVDSEPVHSLALQTCLRRYGVDLSAEELQRRFMGIDNVGVARILRDELKLDLPANFAKMVEQLTFDLAATQVSEMPHANEVLTALATRGTQLAVGTNSTIALATAMLTTTRLITHFGDRIVTREHVKTPKPAPDIYLRAQELTGQPAQRCLVVEDSVPGVRAARAAGIAVTGYSHAGPGPEVSALLEAGAARVIGDLRELL